MQHGETARRKGRHGRLRPRPWRAGNRFELLVDGDRFFPRMLAAIERARRYVWAELYLVRSGAVSARFIDALLRACARGVSVRIILDDFGALGLSRADRERLTAGGAELLFFNRLHLARLLRNMFRDHRKLLVVDGTVAFVGGAGLTDDFDPPGDARARWRETMVQIEGPVLTDWQTLFVDVWNHYAQTPVIAPALANVSPRDGMRGRVAVGVGLLSHDITRALISRIERARSRVWISTAYFIPSRRLRRALRRAAQRGVDVRLLAPGEQTDHPAVRHAGRRYFPRLLWHGVRIFEYQPRFLHSKVVLCDDWVSVGSSNFDRWNLHWNLEANQEVLDARFAEAAKSMFERDFANSVEYDYSALAARSPWARTKEALWGTVDLWLERLSHIKALRAAHPLAPEQDRAKGERKKSEN